MQNLKFIRLFMQHIENNIAHFMVLILLMCRLSRHAAYFLEEVLISLWIKKLLYFNSSSANKG